MVTMKDRMASELGDLNGKHLKFSEGNAKLKGIMSLSLPAGHACPGANQCYSKTVAIDGFKAKAFDPALHKKVNQCGYKVQDGPNCQFRCFAATDEAKYRATRLQRWHNFLLLQGCNGHVLSMIELIERSLPATWAPIRLHVAGDFFSQAYFDAWLEVARKHPQQVFYAYTKSVHFWVNRLDQIPANVRLTASYGGKHDELIAKHGLKYAKVVFTEAEAVELGLEIDHDDSHAYGTGGSFALLLHGTQPAGSVAAKAWSALKMQGKGGYHNQKNGRLSLGAFYADKRKRNSGGINSPAKEADMSTEPAYPIEMIVDNNVEVGA